MNAKSIEGNLKDVLVIQENFNPNTGGTQAKVSTIKNGKPVGLNVDPHMPSLRVQSLVRANIRNNQ